MVMNECEMISTRMLVCHLRRFSRTTANWYYYYVIIMQTKFPLMGRCHIEFGSWHHIEEEKKFANLLCPTEQNNYIYCVRFW